MSSLTVGNLTNSTSCSGVVIIGLSAIALPRTKDQAGQLRRTDTGVARSGLSLMSFLTMIMPTTLDLARR